MSQTLTNPYMAFAVDLAVGVLLRGTIVLAIAGMAAWFLRGGLLRCVMPWRAAGVT